MAGLYARRNARDLLDLSLLLDIYKSVEHYQTKFLMQVTKKNRKHKTFLIIFLTPVMIRTRSSGCGDRF